MYDLKKLIYGLEVLGCPYDDNKIDKLIRFYEFLIEKNKVMNLTAIVEFEDVVRKHFLDSLSIVLVNDCLIDNDIFIYKKNKLIDVGTGAGFPGIPISIFFENIEVVLVDSLKKRIEFLIEVCETLKIDNVKCIHSRSEDLARNEIFRERFDIATSRAVAKLPVLLEYTVPFLKENGFLIAYKGPDVDEEIILGENSARILGGEIQKKIDFLLPESDEKRSLVIVKKIKSTPSVYPRKAGIAQKMPLGL